MESIVAGGHTLEYRRIPGRRPAPAIVLLHEGLGCAAMWRKFPEQLAAETGCPVLVYSRYGYGGSEVLDTVPRPLDYLAREALGPLPELLDKLDIQRPILVGHSDGASIALIHAAAGTRPVAAVVAMAPHLFVEDITIAGIRDTVVQYETGALRARLAQFHRDIDRTFRGWSETWLMPAFRDWNIEEGLARIRCPVLGIQGHDDEYATMRQLDRLAELVPQAQLMKLADCRHSPQRDQLERVLDEIRLFAAGVS